MYVQLPTPDPPDNCYTMYFLFLKNIYPLGNPYIHCRQLLNISQLDKRHITHPQMTPDQQNNLYIYHSMNSDPPGSLYTTYSQQLT
jgi:hypothetical protein